MRLSVFGLVACATAACTGALGTVTIELTAAPGSDVLSRINRVRLELDNPPTIAEATRDGDGLTLDLEVDANDGIGSLTLEAFDTSGALIAVGFSAPLPLSSIDGVLTLYLAPPMSVASAPVGLDPPRVGASIAPLSFGAVVAGGIDAAGLALSDMVIYNVYDHAFQVGLDMPAARSGQAIAVSESGVVYLFGGRDTAGDLSEAFVAFDTRIAPAGLYLELQSRPELARSEPGAYLGGERAIVLGNPPVLLAGGEARAATGPALDGTVTSTRFGDFDLAIAVGEGTASTGAATINHSFAALSIAELPAPAELQRVNHAAAPIAGGDILIVGGAVLGVLQSGAVRYRAANGDFVVIDSLLATPRANPAVAATDRYVVVAGGTDELGAVLDSVEVFNLADLTPVATLALSVPRTGATAITLGNGQVMIAAGTDDGDQPIGVLDLFTPDI